MSNSSAEKFNGRIVEQPSNDSSYISQPKPTFAQKTKRHCARFWWLHLIVFCVCFLIIALCLVYAGLPKIAQEGVDASSIEIKSLSFLDSKPESYLFSQDGILSNPKIFTPTLDPFLATVYLVQNGVMDAKSMIEFPMPSIHALDNSAVNVPSVNTTINNMDAVFNYTVAVLTTKTIEQRLFGITKLHIGALPVNTVHFEKTITYAGMNGLEGFNVTDIRVNLSAPAGTPNLKGTAFIPNVSPLTINMGNVTLNMATEKEGIVGNATINEMTLVPGDNKLALTGFVETAKILSSMNSTGFANLLIWGKSAIADGEHLTYYEHALVAHNLTLSMNVNQVLRDSGIIKRRGSCANIQGRVGPCGNVF